ncbi:hypothetical protein SDC9_126957 [bioreactor metagenome]|uniref:Uncharacterized protein n=1 Tax=bioreactor metagenome TaxID=1076179 RepID=A0A645CSP1_9ZZZZ
MDKDDDEGPGGGGGIEFGHHAAAGADQGREETEIVIDHVVHDQRYEHR